MKGLAQIVILHPAAIGDAMLATPVPKALKANFPSAKITYWTHESLIPLLSMCPSIDAFVPYKRKQSLFGLSTTLKSLKPDLFINLTSAPKIKILSWFAAGQVAHYHKAKDGVEPIIHAVDNFLATVQSIVPSVPSSLFPTVEVSVDARASFYRAWKDRLGFDERSAQTIVALVPGVGNIRPNRAWNLNHWRDLALQLGEKRSHRVVRIGVTDEVEIVAQVSRLCQGKV